MSSTQEMDKEIRFLEKREMICKKRGVLGYRKCIQFRTLWKWDQGLQIYTDPYKSNGRSKKWHFSYLKINSLVDKYHSCQAPSQLTAISHHQQPVNHDKPNHIRMKTWTKYDLHNSRVKMWKFKETIYQFICLLAKNEEQTWNK